MGVKSDKAGCFRSCYQNGHLVPRNRLLPRNRPSATQSAQIFFTALGTGEDCRSQNMETVTNMLAIFDGFGQEVD